MHRIVTPQPVSWISCVSMSRRSYEQSCSLAVALDLVGERWTLLLVRELLHRPKRYTDLLEGLPGIATNLLASRLEKLEAEGLVRRRKVGPPTPAVVYELTEDGLALEEAVVALVRWGGRFMASVPRSYRFSAEWVPLALKAFLGTVAPDDATFTCELRMDGERLFVLADAGRLEVTGESAAEPDVVVAGRSRALLGVASGDLSLRQAEQEGLLSLSGSPTKQEELRRLLSAAGARIAAGRS